MSKRKRIFDIIQIGNREDIPSSLFDIVISLLIVISITVTYMQTFQMYANNGLLGGIELFTVIIFLVEYVLRLWTADFLYPDEANKGRAVVRFVFSAYGIIDLLTIVSYFMPSIYTTGVVALRMLRVIRIFRLFKLGENTDSFNIIASVLRAKKAQILSAVVLLSMLLLMSSMLIYSVEHEVNPGINNGFDALWFSMASVLTVGYGDVTMVTVTGRIVSMVVSFLGVLFVAIPTGVISAGFVEYYHDNNYVCPHCNVAIKEKTNFCPICGVKLKAEFSNLDLDRDEEL